MKKSMIALAAAALCGSVFAIESANVVGYCNDGLTAGKFKMICAQFKVVGKDASKMTLGDFVPGGTWAAGDTMKIFKDNSGVEMTVKYVDATTLAKVQKVNPEATVGWYNKTDTGYLENLNSKIMPLGTTVMAYTTKASSYVTTAGEVVESEDGRITFSLTAGKFAMIGNCTPVALTLGDFVPGGTWAAGDTMKIFKDNSGVEMTVKYVDATTLAKVQKVNPEATVGWYNKTDTGYLENLNNRVVPAGCGFMAYTTKTASTISIPSAL